MWQPARIEYVVEPAEGHWTVTYQGRSVGRYRDRQAAMRSAVADARRVREHGYRIRVMVHCRDGRLRTLPDRLLAVVN